MRSGKRDAGNQGIQVFGGSFTAGAAAAGDHATAVHSGAGVEDMAALAKELAQLLEAARNEAKEPEHDAAVGSLAAAESAAKRGDEESAFDKLKAAGQWALDLAKTIGVPVAVKALEKALFL